MARPHDSSADESDDSPSSPLLPPPTTSNASHATTKGWGSLRWYQPVLALFAILAILAAFRQGFAGLPEGGPLRKEDPAWPTNVGYAGPTPTGKEAFAAATSYPSNHDTSPLNPPASLVKPDFDILHYLGNLSPWRTVNHGLTNATAEVPAGCEVEQVQLLHRHGARYPTTGAGTEAFAKNVVGAAGFKATGDLAFLNDWQYKLGAEILTPFGRNQLFSLGVSFREKYGSLLKPGQKPVFRTESQDRMLKSALNFAAGFFGIPFEDQYHQLITIEWPGFNNTLAPYMTCENANRRDLTHGPARMAEWMQVYLANALERLQPQVEGVELTVRDVFNMQLLCAYELVALGGSAFCPLFTEEEFKGFEYAHDIEFWDIFAFGQPAQAAVGKGWVQEWLARTLSQPLSEFNSTTNSSLHDATHFPLDQNFYVDATHDVIISAVLTTLNFTSFARSPPLSTDRIPSDLSFVTSSVSPFASNLHSQVLFCPSSKLTPAGKSPRFVRWILNDGVIPLDNLPGCATNPDGLCHLDAFVAATRSNLESIDWAYDCLADYSLPKEGVIDGRPPRHN